MSRNAVLVFARFRVIGFLFARVPFSLPALAAETIPFCQATCRFPLDDLFDVG